MHNQSVTRRTRVVLGIDPGTTKSAYALIQGEAVLQHGKAYNDELIGKIIWELKTKPEIAAIESIVSQGRKFVGNETFATAWWSGRFYEILKTISNKSLMVRRSDVANFHVKNNYKKGDPQVRAAIIDYYGGDKRAIGTKKEPGPLYHVTADQWSALGIALYAQWTTPVESSHG